MIMSISQIHAQKKSLQGSSHPDKIQDMNAFPNARFPYLT